MPMAHPQEGPLTHGGAFRPREGCIRNVGLQGLTPWRRPCPHTPGSLSVPTCGLDTSLHAKGLGKPALPVVLENGLLSVDSAPFPLLPISHVCTLVPTETTPGGVPPTRPWPDGCLPPTKMVSVSPEAGTPTSCTAGSPCPRWVPRRAAWAVLGSGPAVLREAELCWALGRCSRL